MLLYTLQFDPKMPEANYDYGMLMLSEGRLAEAAEHFRISSTSAPYKQEPRDQLAKFGSASALLANATRLQSTDTSSALSQARISAAVDPTSVDAYLLIGKLYEAEKKKAEALAAYQKVLSLDPGNATALAAVNRVNNAKSK
jgi:Tfp pilus assembly protein PilF